MDLKLLTKICESVRTSATGVIERNKSVIEGNNWESLKSFFFQTKIQLIFTKLSW